MQLKHLCRILEKNSQLEILGYVAVRGGIARVTNLEVAATMPCDLPDGLYYGKAWTRDQFIRNEEISLDEYPEIPSPSGKSKLTIQAEDIARVIEACGDKWSLSGFLVEYTKSGEYLLVATDGHRLHCSGQMDLLKTKGKNHQLIVHKKAWDLLQLHDSWEMASDEHNVFFHHGDTVVSSRIIDEKYPNFRSVVPDLSKFTVIGHEDLLDCMAALHRDCNRIGSNTRNNGLTLYKRDNNTLGVSRHDPTKGKTFRMESGIAFDQAVQAAFNGEYISALDRIDGEKTVYWQNNDSTFYVQHDRGACLVMPLNL
jgi:DNA polymerase-3 subunit beta